VDGLCEVRIDENSIVVSYKGDDGLPIVYKRKNHGDGHFELMAPQIDSKATLHMFNNGKILEGFWLEGGYKGMWRIQLA
jgi:hypothetical protein